jgi:hypothetical protein
VAVGECDSRFALEPLSLSTVRITGIKERKKKREKGVHDQALKFLLAGLTDSTAR